MGVVLDTVGKLLAGYLQKEVPGYEPFTPSDPEHLRGIVEPGDVLLVEGNNRVSGTIKYLTQSTWSHAAVFVGPIDGAAEPDGSQAAPMRRLQSSYDYPLTERLTVGGQVYLRRGGRDPYDPTAEANITAFSGGAAYTRPVGPTEVTYSGRYIRAAQHDVPRHQALGLVTIGF